MSTADPHRRHRWKLMDPQPKLVGSRLGRTRDAVVDRCEMCRLMRRTSRTHGVAYVRLLPGELGEVVHAWQWHPGWCEVDPLTEVALKAVKRRRCKR